MENKKVNFFTDENGCLSMRRLLAFLFGMTSILAVAGNIIIHFFEETDWKIATVTIALPLAGSLLMMFFTSWSDIATVAKAVKKGE